MSNNWTEKQLDVINTRNRNILVSAAAGSGKTAVLVERIIKIITDSDLDVNIDELLVVTFTRAAAFEMKDRVRERLEEMAENSPRDKNISRQLSFIHNANISTIDSFCGKVVKDNFDKIDLDPNFCIGDEIEIEMMKSDIIDTMLEEYYEEGTEEFMELSTQYSEGKLNDNLKDLITSLYKKAEGNINPNNFIDHCMDLYMAEDFDEFINTDFIQKYKNDVIKILKDIKEKVGSAIEIANRSDAFEKAKEQLENIYDCVEIALNSSNILQMREALLNVKNGRFSTKKNCDAIQKAIIKDAKDSSISIINELKAGLFSDDIEERFEEVKRSRNSIKMILKLTKDFIARFKLEKMDKGIIDFTDQAHLALNILNDEDENGNLEPSSIAKQMSKQYYEIMIDEYQDSNYVQEAILSSVCRGNGINNMFMVGDVKQSIYRFRQAEPKLFLNKYNSFSENLNSDNCKIILDKNFRSRKEVINSVNYIFEYIMSEGVGGINYKDKNQLVLGAYYNEAPTGQDNSTEFMIVEGADKSVEAEYVAEQIKKITDPVTGMKITNEKGNMRPVEYRDIAILLRAVRGNSQIFVNQLENNGIPAYAVSNSGYYEALEIRNIVSMLSVIDNPLQDIHLSAVLFSPMFSFTANELATVKSEHPANYLYNSLVDYKEDGLDKNLCQKVSGFLNMLDNFRDMVSYTSVYELINNILDVTGYGYYILSMPNGKKRYLNIQNLKDKAVAYDQISFKGLFNFVRYIEKIEFMGKDDKEASAVSEKDNLVRITTIHKSKGLQFPIVFLCDTNSTGRKDNDKILADDIGNIGVDYIDNKLKVKCPTIIKDIIKKNIDSESKGELLRLLYVALTRAEEKLFIIGRCKDMEKTVNALLLNATKPDVVMPYLDVIKSNSFMLLASVISKNKAFYTNNDFVNPNVENELNLSFYDEECDINVSFVRQDEILISKEESQITDDIRKEAFESLKNSEKDEELEQNLNKKFLFEYPYLDDTTTHSKASVTEIKKESMSYDEMQDGYQQFDKPSNHKKYKKEIVPDFILKADEHITGARLGTAYHRIFELLKMNESEYSPESIENMINEFIEQGFIDKADGLAVDSKKVFNFTKTNLFSRMKNAYNNNTLYKERQFLMGRPIKELKPNSSSEETMIIQGIIDVCFEEDEKFVIADYKTDKVKSMEELVKLYKVQLECYKEAIEQISKIEVKELIIYSVYLDDEITI